MRKTNRRHGHETQRTDETRTAKNETQGTTRSTSRQAKREYGLLDKTLWTRQIAT